MGLIRKQQIIASLFLVLLIRQQFETSSSSSSFSKVEATSRLLTNNKFRSSEGDQDSGSHDHQYNSSNSSSNLTVLHHQSKNGFHLDQGFINGSNIDEDVFDVDKRRIHTGPNPLHNKR
ncbi:hypothetical protein BVC80_8219g9 [Macleaya cordata]|uniref:Uncharacterized protein n=1 Tax=Macleaya cordata TaxID=56857 RepID=A0A200QJG6_MACCD|nr:hypothetical protein BVC80_8219g9 [Macleaya cordata]